MSINPNMPKPVDLSATTPSVGETQVSKTETPKDASTPIAGIDRNAIREKFSRQSETTLKKGLGVISEKGLLILHPLN